MVRAYRFSCFTVVAELCNSFVSSTVMIYDLACECVVCDVLMSNVDAELFADVRKSQGTVTAGVSGVEL